MSYELTTDGERMAVELDEFIADNGFGGAEARALRALSPGQAYTGGGGAQPEWTIRRLEACELVKEAYALVIDLGSREMTDEGIARIAHLSSEAAKQLPVNNPVGLVLRAMSDCLAAAVIPHGYFSAPYPGSEPTAADIEAKKTDPMRRVWVDSIERTLSDAWRELETAE